jgi:5,10-methylenetetrahydromethanopterin reductase
MRWGVQLPGSYPIDKQLEFIELADELGFYSYSFNDEIYHYDIWSVMALAAQRTKNIRLIAVTNVVINDPVYMAQRLLTIDKLSDGRVGSMYSIGSPPTLKQMGFDLSKLRIIPRLREAQQVLRSVLDTSLVDFAGQFYNYDHLAISPRAVQQHIPLTMGGIKGPLTFELAGEVSDGLVTGLLYSREALRYAADHFKIGAAKAGRNWQDLELTCGMIGTIGEDSAAAYNVAGKIGAYYLPALGDEAALKHGIDPKRLEPIKAAFMRGDYKGAIELTPKDIADSQVLGTGSPDEVIEQVRMVQEEGYNSIVINLNDVTSVKAMTGIDVGGVPDVFGQLQLLHDKIMPAFR